MKQLCNIIVMLHFLPYEKFWENMYLVEQSVVLMSYDEVHDSFNRVRILRRSGHNRFMMVTLLGLQDDVVWGLRIKEKNHQKRKLL